MMYAVPAVHLAAKPQNFNGTPQSTFLVIQVRRFSVCFHSAVPFRIYDEISTPHRRTEHRKWAKPSSLAASLIRKGEGGGGRAIARRGIDSSSAKCI